MRLTFHFDAGHGWLAVPLADFPDALSFGTGFGFLDTTAGIAYLEEDCETPAFLDAHPEVVFADVARIDEGLNARCRSLPRIPDASAA